MEELKTKQQVIDKLKQAEKVLVTVSKNPSVDALSAALGLTLLLDEQKKYATAIFSGETPPALAFLEPEKTFDDTTDSLRDFIIALNKEKADHLRYKVVDDAVKIFITPYKTTITEEDLEFSQGDYNVELVVAIGVDNQEDLDAALDNHGQILHDAAIVTISAGEQSSTLGGIDWRDQNASSLSEMVASLAEGLKDKADKKSKGLLTKPIATALLTGIVAETERFSNERTSSRAMTIAATLMSAGADQQLIATELQSTAPQVNQEEVSLDEPDDQAEERDAPDEPVETDSIDANGGLSIHHDPNAERPRNKKQESSGETLAELDDRVRGTDTDDTEPETEALIAEAKEHAEVRAHGPHPDQPAEAFDTQEELEGSPLMGGTLNATTAQAEDDARRAVDTTQNMTILSHGTPAAEAEEPPVAPPVDPIAPEIPVSPEVSVAAPAVSAEDALPPLQAAPFAVSGEMVIEPPIHDQDTQAEQAPQPPAFAQASPVEVPAAPAAAYGADTVPAEPLLSPDGGLPMPPPIPDFSQGAVGAPALPLPPMEQPQILGDILNPAAPEVAPVQSEAPQNAYGAPQDQDAIASAYAAAESIATPVSQSATVPLVPQAAPEPQPQQAVQPSGAYAAASADPAQYQIPPQP